MALSRWPYKMPPRAVSKRISMKNGRSFGAPVFAFMPGAFSVEARPGGGFDGVANVPRGCIGPAIAPLWSAPQSLLGVVRKTVVYVGWLPLLTSYAGFTVL